MRLTKLEIKGFKSFAEKTVINFNDNITGIVGPNGCGKSNVVDSIRWVLGEQKTSQLRLEKMDNVIFNGTKQRKPAGLAEVSLTFENTKNLIPTEYNHVTITRKLFRDGDSEYRINDVTCRLKDIHNLFLDTGIGTDSYAIIELGMVDEILQDRDHSRRKLFEQAAGISKYKIRKKETLSKLKSTEEDLTRLEDLLFEIERNLKSLESQARKAERYIKIKEEYKVNSLELTKYKLQNHKETYSALKTQSEQEINNKTQVDNEITALEVALQQKKLENLTFEKSLSAVQKNLNELIGGLGSKENERNILKEKIRFSEEKIVESNQSLLESRDQIERLSADIERLTKIIAEEEINYQNVSNEFEQLKEEVQLHRNTFNAIKSNLDEDKITYNEQEKHIFDREKQYAIRQTQIENIKNTIEQHVQERLFKSEELASVKGYFSTVETKKQDIEKKLNELLTAEKDIQERISETEKILEKTKQELAQENRKLDSKRNEYNLTKSMIDNLEGFPEAVKFLKKNSKALQEAPLLSDIILCKEEYRVAIENYLEPFLSYYVVEKYEDAVFAINLLHDSAKGKAHFFVLENLQQIKIPSLEIKAGLVSALEVIEIDKNYQKLIQLLLNEVYIGDFNNEADIKKYQTATGIFLSKSGKYINKSYSLSGGAVGLFEGKRLGRTKNLDLLKNDIDLLEKSVIKSEREINKHQEILLTLKSSTKKDEVAQLQVEQNTILQEYTKLHTNISNFESFIESGTQRLKQLEEQIAQLQAENKQTQSELDILKENNLALKNKIALSDNEFVSFSNTLNERNQYFNQQQIMLIQQENDLKNKKQEFDYKSNQKDDLEKQLDKLTAAIETNTAALEENKVLLKELESELLGKYDNRTDIEKEVEEAEKNYYKSRGEIGELENEVREKLRKRDLISQLINDLQNKLGELKLNINSVKERLNIEFGVDINELLNQSIQIEKSEEELEQEVNQLKKKIEHFGEVNPMAIEAYNEIKTRYDFLIGQKHDLIASKENLLETIREIDTNAKEQFMDAFTKIRENFINTFRILFTKDDDCDLILSNIDNPLEAEIDIIAKPKGKRPLSISQLSGGEKTLTATALLFSLYLLKPAPFCIFDEVDAPLDDTNIAKFNNIINEFSKESQFIIVTHNKQTMASVDVIYGVTMPEQGVSRVVPVDFRSLQNN
jgi:chromosome segregation protein